MVNLKRLSDEAFAVAKMRGFYSHHNSNDMDSFELVLDLESELRELKEAFANSSYSPKTIDDSHSFFIEHIKDTVEDELADIIIRVLSYCSYANINIEKHILRKMEFNKTRVSGHSNAHTNANVFRLRKVKSCVSCRHLEEMVTCDKHDIKVDLENICDGYLND